MVRYKNRYLVMRAEFKDGKRTATTTSNNSNHPKEGPPPPPSSAQALTAACRDAVGAALGPAALAAAMPALSVRFHAPTSGVCVVRCARDGHGALAAALCRRVTLVALRSASLALLTVQGAPRTARAAALSLHWRLLAASASAVEARGRGAEEDGAQGAAPGGGGNPSEEARRAAQAQLRERKRRRQDGALAAAAAADALRLVGADL